MIGARATPDPSSARPQTAGGSDGRRRLDAATSPIAPVRRHKSAAAPGTTPPPRAIAVARSPSSASGSQRGAANVIADLVPLPLTPSADPISATCSSLDSGRTDAPDSSAREGVSLQNRAPYSGEIVLQCQWNSKTPPVSGRWEDPLRVGGRLTMRHPRSVPTQLERKPGAGHRQRGGSQLAFPTRCVARTQAQQMRRVAIPHGRRNSVARVSSVLTLPSCTLCSIRSTASMARAPDPFQRSATVRGCADAL